MAKTLVFEGCPACGLGEFGQIVSANVQEFAMQTAKGGAIGAGVATVIDMVMPRLPFVGRLPAYVRPLVAGGVSIGLAYYLRDRSPEMAVGVGIGGAAVAAYKLIATLLGKVVPVSGLGFGEEAAALPPEIEVEETAGETGVIVPVEEELSGYGYGYGQEEEIIIE